MGDSPSKEENSKVTITLTRENTTTDYRNDGTKTEQKTVECCTLSAQDKETFTGRVANVKAIGYY